MLKIDIIKFEAQDVVTASYPELPEPCGCINACDSAIAAGYVSLPHVEGCQCNKPNGPHGPFSAD